MIPLPSNPKIIKKEDDKKAIIEIEGFYPGYGVTIGNSLRRVLISSLEGGAVTQFKIKGVQHEFSVLPNVAEDVINIMLNLKGLRFKIFSDEPQKATLKVKGERNVKGSDFELPPQLELVNKDHHIATLTSKSASLEMEILVEKGIGFRPREFKKKQEKTEIGIIPVDAIFSPIRKVSIKIENMRVGERTDYDKLFLDIETDGTITPEEAVYKASKILIDQFSLIKSSFNFDVDNKEKVDEKESLSDNKKSSVKHDKKKKGKKIK
jgi:DNA-directed RNA polymerase subunit alpha